jgi:hypothetical protein
MIDECPTYVDQGTCDQMNCTWNSPVPLFTEAFCHPVTINNLTSKAQWEDCIGKE